jgi:hypothetical protein
MEEPDMFSLSVNRHKPRHRFLLELFESDFNAQFVLACKFTLCYWLDRSFDARLDY